MREKNYQKDWTKEFEHSKISHPLWVTTAHRQKGEIHIYINIKQTNKEWNKIRCLLNTNLLHWVIVDVDNLVQVACYHLKILYRKLTRSKFIWYWHSDHFPNLCTNLGNLKKFLEIVCGSAPSIGYNKLVKCQRC